ncbi:TetR/AcrR family transcriptional regulator [Amnibacterium endophyticum]|uniref:TetR/AcrR family transcriptional regulator n=1 Tax=Amnibacterium endophyticum TaxID=2109337 RepID=A0ABW4LFF9_9MICO
MSGIPARQASPARLRLQEVADRLFTADGIVATGVDRLLSEAKVTKATFYKQYGSKDALILEYVVGRDSAAREALQALQAHASSPVEALRSLVAAAAGDAARPGFRGDPFTNAASEFTDRAHPVRVAVAEHRDWFTGFLEDRFRELGHPRPGAAADEFVLLRDGVVSGAYAGDAVAAVSAFERAAERLIAQPG